MLEITETMIMSDPHRAHHVLNELAGMGVILSIDDFGTGYSSLAYLRDLPVHESRLTAPSCTTWSRTVTMRPLSAWSLTWPTIWDCRRIAEGVEDETTWEALRALGCDNAQGYHLARPMPADQISSWTSQHLRETAEMLSGCRVHGGGCDCPIAPAGSDLQVAAASSDTAPDQYGPEAPVFPGTVGPADGASDASPSHAVVAAANESPN